MPEVLATQTVPLVTGDDGVIRVESTRVPLETIVAAFEAGATAEGIAQQYPTVSLAAAYQVIGYYLHTATNSIITSPSVPGNVWPPG